MLFWTYIFGMTALMASAISGSILTGKHDVMQMFEVDVLKFCGNRAAGTYEHPKNCRETIVCTATGTGSIVTCPPGQMWSPTPPPPGCKASTFSSCKQRDILCGKAQGDKSILGRAVSMEFELASLNATLVEPQFIDADTFKLNDATDRATFAPAQAPGFPCQGKGSKESRSPIPGTTCTQFNACIKGRAMLGTCPAGTSFDAPTLMCRPTSQARCARAITCTTDGVAPVPTLCDRFQICCATLGKVVYCKSGFSFDTATGMCLPSSKATCVPTP